jgi:formylglycine-generating enzyme required for sulfatase activity
MRDEAGADRAREDFIVLFFSDRDRGAIRTEEAYRALYPDFEDVISSELRRLGGKASEAAAAEPAAEPSREARPAPHAWQLDRYRIDRELGRGGQGTVFLAFDTKLGRPVALKVLKAHWSGLSAMVRRFEREAQALARLDHPGLATVHDAASAHGVEYFVMPYVEGRTLAHELAARDPAVALDRAAVLRCVTLVEKAGRALHVAHEAGLVHRDVKPGNIMVTAGDEPVVLDFGLALFRELEAEKLTVTGDILGTAPFMAPEQIAGERSRVDRRTDVFALAATLRMLVSEGGRLGRAVPPDLAAVIDAGSDPDPDRRYASAAAFADDLERVRGGRPIAVCPPGPVRRFILWCRRAPAAAAIVVLPPLALLGGLVGLTLKNESIRAAARELELREEEANVAARLATARFTDFQRLNDLRRIQDLELRESELWPPRPDGVPAIERWLADAGELLGRLPEHRAALEALRLHGRASTASRRSWSFDRVEDQWLADNLGVLVDRLQALALPIGHGCTRAAVLRKLDVARTIETTTLVEPTAAWRAAMAAIAIEPAYRGLRIEPIIGLIPLGRDPASHLWEFAHVLSGTPPARDAAGRFVFTEESSIVLVLIPGGTVRMGARPPIDEDEPARDHVDPAAQPNERPVHEVTLDAFLISKYEMTQAQWLRATGSNPSHHRPLQERSHGNSPSLTNPVEMITFEDCEEVLRQLGLSIPTEAQWERAARAGTSTPWWPGETIESFLTTENLCDRTRAESEHIVGLHDPERNDGSSGTAPVGTYPPNPFGLHDVIGNVREFCCDRLTVYSAPPLPGDGLRPYATFGKRAARGGSLDVPARKARSAHRASALATSPTSTVGVRPARSLASR